ncbi:hypothetical protein HHK36_031748 [Tetracentron sinense]|uniref:Cyclin-like domain-containing protein n=1 Tax=Tetracentron sinense TaxID=13715 RepID=A0A835D149_TETSI|nr:hypothetical protein HHK36_031748 [Tetracentron sinense]
MNRNATSVLQSSNSRRKQKIQPVSYSKKLRSKIPRRKRFRISPILSVSLNSLFSDTKTDKSAFSVASSSSSCLPGEISCTSSRISVGYVNLNKKPRSSRRQLEFEEIQGSGAVNRAHERCFHQEENNCGAENRRITRSYFRQKQNERIPEKKENVDHGVKLSESSCVESISGADARVIYKTVEFPDKNSKLKNRSRKGVEIAEKIEGNSASAGIELSGISYIQPFSQDNSRNFSKLGEFSGKSWNKRARTSKGPENSPEPRARISEVAENSPQENVVSETSSYLQSLSEAKKKIICPSVNDLSEKTRKDEENRAPGAEFSEISRNYVESNLTISNSESTAQQKPTYFEFSPDLACTERLSYEDDSDYSNSKKRTFSELESEISPNSSDLEFSDYTPSFLFESPSEFSERSAGDSNPSGCYSLFLQYTLQFTKSTYRPDIGVSSCIEDKHLDEFILLKFEDEEEEESYKKFRSRERRRGFLHDYAEEYCTTTEYGNLVLQQRFLMVNWIVEQSNTKELQCETMFLGVSLLDRFLSRGFFKDKRSLQIVGVACLTLATRIEENQPLNCVRQSTFEVESNMYSRCEVVAMEWLVQEVLNFNCLLPTTYNFLWFYLKAARADANMEKTAKYLAMLSLMDHERPCYWPSTIAAGLVILASLAANHDDSCQWVMETHVRTRNDDLPECIQAHLPVRMHLISSGAAHQKAFA